jgi:hypothetical protein
MGSKIGAADGTGSATFPGGFSLKSILRTLAFCLFAFSATSLLAQQALTNDSILKMHAAGLSDDLIATAINSQPGTYSTSTDDLIALKTAGLGDKVIGAMIAKQSGASPSPAAAPTTVSVVMTAPPPPLPGVTDVGVYYKNRTGQWTDVFSENVNFKTGGVLKSIATDGIVKGDLNGHLTGPASKLQLTKDTEFVVYVMEGQSAGDYQLLHMHTHKDGREFRSLTGGVLHESSGAERDTIDFTSKKIAPRTYLITLPGTLENGEYGFLPPGTMNSGKNLASSGKMYTFGVEE